MTALAALHGAALLASPSSPAIAVGLWWNSNTIAHSFIHRPFFRWRPVNAAFGLYQSLLLGIPQALWRERHLAHHAGISLRPRISSELVVQTSLIVSLWLALATYTPEFLLTVYAPGYAAGLLLCALHGHYEHADGTTSHYGRLYNVFFFNDGYHAEHHAHPHAHWTRLPQYRASGGRVSRWPAPLRWLEPLTLESLERLVLRSRVLQRYVLRSHAQAFRTLLDAAAPIERVAIVGGGLYPRTALILRRLLPSAHITVLDASRANLERARALVSDRTIEFRHGRYPEETGRIDCDLLIIPLSFAGDRRAFYQHVPAPAVIVHDWIWRSRGRSRVVSFALLKRLNLVRP